MFDRWSCLLLSAAALVLCVEADAQNPGQSSPVELPFITTKKPVTLLSANEGVSDILWRRTPEGLIDFEMKTPDSFTVIRLWPDRPPFA
jgi:hypothetical protein